MNELTIQSDFDKARLIKMIQALDLAKPWRFQWGLKRKSRSLSANALSHVWYRDIALEINRRGGSVNPEKVKEMLKANFLGFDVIEFKDFKTGEKYTKDQLKRTSTLDIGEFCYFMQQIENWAFEMGIPLEAKEDSEYMEWQKAQNG